MQRLPVRQAAQESDQAVHLRLDGGVLLVGADDVLALTPQRLQGFNSGDRSGSHNSVIPSVAAREA